MNTQRYTNNNSLSLLFFLRLISLKSLYCNEFKAMTEINKIYVGRELKTYYDVDWLSCLKECSRHPDCLSYNFQNHLERTQCDLYDHGIKLSCGADPFLIHSRKSFFQHLRPSQRGGPEDQSPPRVTIELKKRSKQIIVECYVIAQQAAEVTWYKNGQLVPSHSSRTSRYVYLSHVTVTRTTINTGNYTCTAATKSGKVSSYVIISKRLVYPEAAAVFALNGDGGLRDISGNNNPAGKLGMDIPLAPGPHGLENGSYQLFNLPNSSIEFPNNGGLDTRTSTTISIWIYINESISVTSPVVSYVSRNEPMRNWGVTLLIRDSFLAIDWESRQIDQEWMEVRPRDKTDLFLKTWLYLVASYNYTSGVGSLWVNGFEMARKTIGRYELNTEGSVLIGPLKGRVSCLQIYKNALSKDMIKLVKNRCLTEDNS